MADMNERDAKLVQYLSEAYGKERELETSLQAHISMTTRPPYKKRLQQHLRETKAHAKGLERRIKKLGGGGQTGQTAVGKAMAAAKGPLHAMRGAGEQEKMLKNARPSTSTSTRRSPPTSRSRRWPRRSATRRRRSWRWGSAARRNGWRSSSRARSKP